MLNEEYITNVENILENIKILCKKGGGTERALELWVGGLENRVPSINVYWDELYREIERKLERDKRRYYNDKN